MLSKHYSKVVTDEKIYKYKPRLFLMVKIFSTQFPLEENAKLEDILEVGKTWILGVRNIPFKQRDLNSLQKHGDSIEGKGYRVELGKVETEDSPIFGLNYTSPGRPGVSYNVSMVTLKESNTPLVSVVLNYESEHAGGKTPFPPKKP